jgi:hypothetical protein
MQPTRTSPIPSVPETRPESEPVTRETMTASRHFESKAVPQPRLAGVRPLVLPRRQGRLSLAHIVWANVRPAW